MSTLARWLIMALASALAGAVAHVFEGSCPLEQSSWVCGHWDLVVTVAAFVLGAFGVQVKRPKLATSKAGLRVEVPLKRNPEPKPEGRWVAPEQGSNIVGRTQAEIDADGPGGG